MSSRPSVPGDPAVDESVVEMIRIVEESQSKAGNCTKKVCRDAARALRHALAEFDYYASIRGEQSIGGTKGAKRSHSKRVGVSGPPAWIA